MTRRGMLLWAWCIVTYLKGLVRYRTVQPKLTEAPMLVARIRYLIQSETIYIEIYR